MAEQPVARAEALRVREALKNAVEALSFAVDHASNESARDRIRRDRDQAQAEYERGKHFYDETDS